MCMNYVIYMVNNFESIISKYTYVFLTMNGSEFMKL